jgi:hypothetical protein
VRYRLADHVVDCHEGPLSAKRRADRDCDPLGHGQQRNHKIRGKRQQCVDMASWSDEYVTLEHRSVIKESDHLVSTRHDRGVQFTAYDLADHIAHRHEISGGALKAAGRASSHHLVVTHQLISFDEEAVVLWIKDSLVDVLASEGPDAVPGVPQ